MTREPDTNGFYLRIEPRRKRSFSFYDKSEGTKPMFFARASAFLFQIPYVRASRMLETKILMGLSNLIFLRR